MVKSGEGERSKKKYENIDTKQSDLDMTRRQTKEFVKVRTRHCSNNVRRVVLSGEIPIEL